MSDLLDDMRRNSAGNWTIKDIGAVCKAGGVNCSPPSGGGSHYKISHVSQRQILTIPFRRPIKPIYIRKLVKFIDAIGVSDGKS
jgi:hypothetical protein